MQRVTVQRSVEASPATVREAMADVETFMRAAKFDEVEVDGNELRLENTVGMFLRVELVLELLDRDGADLAYEQRSGIFDEMLTEYTVEPANGGSAVTATTSFELATPFVGPLFDATVVKRQRRHELTNQFDYLASLSD